MKITFLGVVTIAAVVLVIVLIYQHSQKNKGNEGIQDNGNPQQ